MSVRPSVCPHRTTRLQMDGFSWNFISEYFSKICRENSHLIKIGQEKRILYMNTKVYFRSYLAQFFLEWKMCQAEFVEKLETHFMFNIYIYIYFFFLNRALYEIMWKNVVERGRPQMTIWRMFIACWIPKATNKHRLFNTHCFSTATVAARTRLNFTLYLHYHPCLISSILWTLQLSKLFTIIQLSTL